ncbi:MAG TPA: hypothetical protein VFV73_24195 [Streptosporangiaceae bacterium]|nr:hypothetical protein [Streptosporangiaceae bacterium]
MPATLNPACPLCSLRFGTKPRMGLHIREDHHQRVPRADAPAHGHDVASTPARTAKEATGRTTRCRRRAGRAMTALRRALRAVNAELPRASQALIRPTRAPQPGPQTPAPPTGQPRNTARRTATERADRDDCLICQAIVSF